MSDIVCKAAMFPLTPGPGLSVEAETSGRGREVAPRVAARSTASRSFGGLAYESYYYDVAALPSWCYIQARGAHPGRGSRPRRRALARVREVADEGPKVRRVVVRGPVAVRVRVVVAEAPPHGARRPARGPARARDGRHQQARTRGSMCSWLLA